MKLIIYLIVIIFKGVQKLVSFLYSLIFKKAKRAKKHYSRPYSTQYTPARLSNITPTTFVPSKSPHVVDRKNGISTYLVKEADRTTLHVSINPEILQLKSKQPYPRRYETKKDRQREFKYKKRKQRDCRWAIMRMFIIYDTLLNSENIYDIKKELESKAFIQDLVFDNSGEYKIRQKDIKIAIRFMKIKIANGECDGDTNQLTLNKFYQLQQLNLAPFIINAYNNLEYEWDRYYNKIKTDRKRVERLEYYLETLDKDLSNHNITQYHDVISTQLQLKQKYIKILKSIQRPTP